MQLNIDQYLQPDGTYLVPVENGTGEPRYFENAVDVYCDFLGFCGCGDPESALDYVRGALQLIKKIKMEVWEKKVSFEDYRKEEDLYFVSTGAKYFMWYALDNLGLIEHGGSVPGWLTTDGENYLHDLEIMCKDFEK